MEMHATQYRITVVETGEFYIGSAKNFDRRMAHHRSELRRGNHVSKVLQARFNSGCSLVVDVEAVGDLIAIRDIERRLIHENVNNPKMVNISLGVYGGDNLTRHPEREKIVERMALATRNRLANLTAAERKILSERTAGSRNGMYGKTHSPETRRKLSEINLGHSRGVGRKLSREHVAKMSLRAKLRVGDKNPFYGKKHSEDTRRKLSIKNKGAIPPNRNKIEINGVTYSSQAEAARQLGVCQATITYRLSSKNPKYRNYKIIKNG